MVIYFAETLMLRHKDGCLFVEWEQKLIHAMPYLYYIELLRSSELYLKNVKSWPDKNEGSAAAPLSREEFTADSPYVRELGGREGFYGHSWFIADEVDVKMWSDNNSEARHIMLVTDFKSLFNAVKEDDVFGGTVAYRKLNSVDTSSLSDLAKIFVKHRRYESEQEFRLLAVREDEEKVDSAFRRIPVDLNLLIQQIVVRNSVSEDVFQIITQHAALLDLSGKVTREED